MAVRGVAPPTVAWPFVPTTACAAGAWCAGAATEASEGAGGAGRISDRLRAPAERRATRAERRQRDGRAAQWATAPTSTVSRLAEHAVDVPGDQTRILDRHRLAGLAQPIAQHDHRAGLTQQDQFGGGWRAAKVDEQLIKHDLPAVLDGDALGLRLAGATRRIAGHTRLKLPPGALNWSLGSLDCGVRLFHNAR